MGNNNATERLVRCPDAKLAQFGHFSALPKPVAVAGKHLRELLNETKRATKSTVVWFVARKATVLA